MTIESIGKAAPVENALRNDAINQQEFIKLFLSQLNNQDPLEPVDNMEFMSQLAQFTNIEQNRRNGELLETLSFISTVNQGTSLLSKTVEIESQFGVVLGTVTTVNFTEEGPRLTVTPAGGFGAPFTNVRLSEVKVVSEGENE